jgi:hypothetical protein
MVSGAPVFTTYSRAAALARAPLRSILGSEYRQRPIIKCASVMYRLSLPDGSGVEVSGGEIFDDGVDGLSADGDRTSPGGAQREQQGHAESDHDG